MTLEPAIVGAIIDRIRGGDIDAYSELVVAYQSEVWKVVAAVPGGMSQIEELVQRTFVQAYQQLDSFEVRRDFGPWLKEIARNQARMELRRSVRESGRLQQYYDVLLREFDSESEVMTEALEETLRSCREELPPLLNQIITERYEQALSFEDIAARWGRSVAAARQLLSRARVMLRECVDRKGGFA